jgi:hypothetical protein
MPQRTLTAWLYPPDGGSPVTNRRTKIHQIFSESDDNPGKKISWSTTIEQEFNTNLKG